MDDKEAWKRLRGICKFYNINLQGWLRCTDDDLLYLADRITFEMFPRPTEEGEWGKYRADRAALKGEYYELLKRVQRRLK
jgi:hypothetical protein